MSTQTRTIVRIAELIAFVMKQPRTHHELRRAIGLPPNHSLLRHLEALQAEGLVYIAGWKRGWGGRLYPVYGWQPSVCHFPDVPKPVSLADLHNTETNLSDADVAA